MPSDNSPRYPDTDKRKFYGRRQGRALKCGRLRITEELLPQIAIPENNDPVILGDLFSNGNDKLILEVGFGGGEHLSGMMRQNPQANYIGCEPFVNGVASFLLDIKELSHDNIRLWPDHAVDLFDRMPDACIDEMYLLFPDPWPKTKHQKRRFVNPHNLDAVSRILKDNALFITATDVDELAEWEARELLKHPDFEWTATQADDWRIRPKGWIPTRYEEKGIEAGRKPSYLTFERKKR